jgi:hypothetical protein
MSDWEWEDDEDLVDPDKSRSQYRKGGEDWSSVDVEFEMRRGRVSMTWPQWRDLERFLRRYDELENFTVSYADYKHLSEPAILVVRDWIQYRKSCR